MPTQVEQTIGQNVVLLADDFPSWVPRRVDSVDCVDHAVARREVRVDIDLARLEGLDDLSLWPRWRGDLLVPLASLSRFAGHTEISVVDESGDVLPRLTKDEERNLALGAVELQARYLLGGSELSDTLRQQLYHFLSNSQPDLDSLRGSEKTDLLLGDSRFRQTLRRLSSTYYLLVPLNLEKGSRRVLQYSFYEHLSFAKRDRASLPAWLRNRIGLAALNVKAPAAGDCTSYHLVLPAPYDLQIANASLQLVPQDGMSFQYVDDDRLPTRAHLYANVASPISEVSSASIDLHLLPTGLVRSSVYSALFIVMTLVAGTIISFFADDHVLPSETGTAVAILLLVPGVLGSTLATPSRHSLTTTLLFPTRLILVLASLMSFIVATAVALNARGALALGVWVAASVVALVCNILLGAQLRRVRGFVSGRG